MCSANSHLHRPLYIPVVYKGGTLWHFPLVCISPEYRHNSHNHYSLYFGCWHLQILPQELSMFFFTFFSCYIFYLLSSSFLDCHSIILHCAVRLFFFSFVEYAPLVATLGGIRDIRAGQLLRCFDTVFQRPYRYFSIASKVFFLPVRSL